MELTNSVQKTVKRRGERSAPYFKRSQFKKKLAITTATTAATTTTTTIITTVTATTTEADSAHLTTQ